MKSASGAAISMAARQRSVPEGRSGCGHHRLGADLAGVGGDAIIIRGDEDAGAGRLPCRAGGGDGAGQHGDAVDQVQRLAGEARGGIARGNDDDGFHAQASLQQVVHVDEADGLAGVDARRSA